MEQSKMEKQEFVSVEPDELLEVNGGGGLRELEDGYYPGPPGSGGGGKSQQTWLTC